MKDFDSWNRVKKRLDVVPQPPLFNEREVWWCSVGVNVGFEVYGKGHIFTRPVLVVKKLSKATFIGIPLTSKRKDNPYYHPIDFYGVAGSALIGQLKTLDSRRLAYRIGTMGGQPFVEIRQLIKAMF